MKEARGLSTNTVITKILVSDDIPKFVYITKNEVDQVSPGNLRGVYKSQ